MIPTGDHFGTMAAPWVTERRLLADTELLLHQLASERIARIIGVPRSGMMPAAFLACRLGVPLFALGTDGVVELQTGLRMREVDPDSDGLTIVVEDSSASGWSIEEARDKLEDAGISAKYAAVYATEKAAKGLDYYGRILPLPHWFSWNIWGNAAMLSGFKLATDFDGVLCPDCPDLEDYDSPEYLAWLESVRPIFRASTATIPYIITARLERYREATEAWLAKHHFRYGKLIMGPWESDKERRQHHLGKWKREQAEALDCRLFVESEPWQAEEISRTIACICPQLETCLVEGTGPSWPEGLNWDPVTA